MSFACFGGMPYLFKIRSQFWEQRYHSEGLSFVVLRLRRHYADSFRLITSVLDGCYRPRRQLTGSFDQFTMRSARQAA